MRGRRLQNGPVDGEYVLHQMRVHFLIPPFRAEILGDRRYVRVVPGVHVRAKATGEAGYGGEVDNEDFP